MKQHWIPYRMSPVETNCEVTEEKTSGSHLAVELGQVPQELFPCLPVVVLAHVSTVCDVVTAWFQKVARHNFKNVDSALYAG
jgi:hypothetical protein